MTVRVLEKKDLPQETETKAGRVPATIRRWVKEALVMTHSWVR